MMLPMTTSRFACAPTPGATRAPDRCTDRQRRILQVKFVAFPGPVAAEPPRSRVADLLSRVLGLLSVARR